MQLNASDALRAISKPELNHRKPRITTTFTVDTATVTSGVDWAQRRGTRRDAMWVPVHWPGQVDWPRVAPVPWDCWESRISNSAVGHALTLEARLATFTKRQRESSTSAAIADERLCVARWRTPSRLACLIAESPHSVSGFASRAAVRVGSPERRGFYASAAQMR